MAVFSFTISSVDIADITGQSGPAVEIVADRGLSRQVKHIIRTAKFGDGYEQRVLDGLNSKSETFSISFNNRDADEINLIAAFLDLKASLNFTLNITNLGGTEAIKVTCEGYNINYGHTINHSLQATFKRVYEP